MRALCESIIINLSAASSGEKRIQYVFFLFGSLSFISTPAPEWNPSPEIVLPAEITRRRHRRQRAVQFHTHTPAISWERTCVVVPKWEHILHNLERQRLINYPALLALTSRCGVLARILLHAGVGGGWGVGGGSTHLPQVCAGVCAHVCVCVIMPLSCWVRRMRHLDSHHRHANMIKPPTRPPTAPRTPTGLPCPPSGITYIMLHVVFVSAQWGLRSGSPCARHARRAVSYHMCVCGIVRWMRGKFSMSGEFVLVLSQHTHTDTYAHTRTF